MISSYYKAVLAQARERAKILKAKVSRPVKEPDLLALRQRCESHLDGILRDLEELEKDEYLERPEMFRQKVSILKKIISNISYIETTGIAALDRMKDDDIFLTRLIFHIHGEVGYPLLPPAVTCLSRQYYSIYPMLGLIQVPLAEADSLLHLPDLYHEIGHPLTSSKDNPKVEPFTNALGGFMEFAGQHFETEYARTQRSSGPRDYFGAIVRQLQQSWVIFWSQEMFCDLFALYTLGSAYAWSHFHLVAERCGDPYRVDLSGSSEHPPDSARMEALLAGLTLVGMSQEAEIIRTRWEELLFKLGYSPNELYVKACPLSLLSEAASCALEGTKGIGCAIINSPVGTRLVGDLLNKAWLEFWKSPTGYAAWEKQTLKNLKNRLASSSGTFCA